MNVVRDKIGDDIVMFERMRMAEEHCEESILSWQIAAPATQEKERLQESPDRTESSLRDVNESLYWYRKQAQALVVECFLV